MSYDQGPHERVSVVCPTCKARLNPRAQWAGRKVRCPDCHSAVTVPTSNPPAQPAPSVPPRDWGEYNVVQSAAVAPPPAADDWYLVVCPTCQARLHPRLDQVGKNVRCPDCDSRFKLPPPVAPLKPKAIPTPGHYGVGLEPPRPERPMEILAAPVERPLAAEATPVQAPRMWLVDGVFNFPWRGEAAERMVLLGLFMLIASEVTALGNYIIEQLGGLNSLSGLVLPFFALAGMWLWFWAFTFGSACVVGIVQDTASSCGEVSNWPEGDWRTWVWPALYLVFQLSLAMVVSYGLYLVLLPALGPPAALVALPSPFILFPILVLCAMEADAPFMPYSPVILAGVVRHWWAWAAAYAMWAMMLAGWLTLSVLGMTFVSPFLSLLITAPLGSALVFISARLLGRLAWRIGQSQPNAGRSKRPRRAAELSPAGPGPS